jgi:hypothetical protein
LGTHIGSSHGAESAFISCLFQHKVRDALIVVFPRLHDCPANHLNWKRGNPYRIHPPTIVLSRRRFLVPKILSFVFRILEQSLILTGLVRSSRAPAQPPRTSDAAISTLCARLSLQLESAVAVLLANRNRWTNASDTRYQGVVNPRNRATHILQWELRRYQLR